MNRIVLTLVSIILLVGVPIYAPQPGQSQPARAIPQSPMVINPGAACQFSLDSKSTAGYTPVPGANTVTVDTTPFFPNDVDVALEFSSEAGVSAAGTQMGIQWSKDGGGPIIFGPEFFAANVLGQFETKTQKVIFTPVDSLAPHTFTVWYAKLAGPAAATVQLFFRCLHGETVTGS